MGRAADQHRAPMGEIRLMALLIQQTFSQRTWPKAGDIDDCWVVSAIQCTNAVAPWLPLLDVREFRAFAKDPDDGVKDGGNVDDIMEGIRNAWPKLAPLVIPVRAGAWDGTLAAIKAGHPFSACVSSAKLPTNYGFQGLHQVTLFHEPNVDLGSAIRWRPTGQSRCASPPHRRETPCWRSVPARSTASYGRPSRRLSRHIRST